ncbi:MAG TPA: cyanophycinase [Gemmatimonadaceae bacterium]|nr:cyanophycinase [Gemmatimonadaceae bacterium]
MTATRATTPRRAAARRRAGRLVLIGGGEERSPDGRVLRHLVDVAGGRRARIVVCGGASGEPEETMQEYRRVFTRLHVAEVALEPLGDRTAGEAPALLGHLEHATAVFFTGGDQLRLVSLLGGTAFGERIQERLQTAGLVVAGTSAGAAAVSATMVIDGPSDGTVRRTDVELAPGLGYWRDTVVDTHFNQRGRVSRLLATFASNPQLLGIGLDEDTAVDVELGRRFRVVGCGAALVFDGRVSHTNAAEVARESVLALFDTRVHVLPDGYGFDLRRKRPLQPRQLPRTGG